MNDSLGREMKRRKKVFSYILPLTDQTFTTGNFYVKSKATKEVVCKKTRSKIFSNMQMEQLTAKKQQLTCCPAQDDLL